MSNRGRIRTLGPDIQNPALCSFQDARSKGQSFSKELLQEVGRRELQRHLMTSKTAVAFHPARVGPRGHKSYTHPFSTFADSAPTWCVCRCHLLEIDIWTVHMAVVTYFCQLELSQPCLSNLVLNSLGKRLSRSFSSQHAPYSHRASPKGG